MRSRYSAFAVGDTDYLLRTWHATTRPRRLELDPLQRWTRLRVVGSTGGSAFESAGTVEFRAMYMRGGIVGEQVENSTFVREDGRWLYVDAVTADRA